ncbi:acyl-CoA carboxylase subunit beta [Kibdelosporangium aridum]|uniref:Acetyl-CoA carboxylase, carboxyltransferase component n=1 Tax=Kibdelosporangium aridum TaxID=2030 RepID=A0A1Y5Y4G2_KIBAR|nr:acyl-CoA carboxylase subunit beta [Kibdelosporangium aridum]SMD25688.1 Acetyl-CoA carboxylase, carboxyltransferase component [Kibdelosporangium aridum]
MSQQASTPAPEPVRHAATTRDHVRRLHEVRRRATVGDELATERQHAKGKLTARQRLQHLLDEGSFTEFDLFRRPAPGSPVPEYCTDGVVTGAGTVHGRRVFAYAQDFRILGGSLGEAHAAKIHKVMDLAIAAGAPLVALLDSGGARIQEGVTALAGYGGIFRRNVRASGVIPQISVVLGPCAGGAAYSPALTDFTFLVRNVSHMFVTGPDVIKTVTGESVTHEELGGAEVHAATSGVATFVADDEETCLEDVRHLISLLPSNSHDLPPSYETDDPPARRCPRLADIVPANPKVPYDVREVIAEIVDDAEFMEVHEHWAENIVCALARMGGRTVGILANQPVVRAGVLDIDTSQKAARFVQMCDAFSIPLVTFVDVPGFLPGVDQEHDGIIRHGAKLLYAYCNATVPRIQVILRKAYGGAYIAMDSRSIGADLSFAWPINEIAVMGAEAAVGVIYRKELAAAGDPEQRRTQLITEYTEELMHPYYASERGLVDDVIDPADTRVMIIRALELLSDKRPDLMPRKHGNPPT